MQDVRDRISVKAQDGRWTGSTADKVAKRLGLESFATKPDALLFDPMLRSTWSLAMAGAWLIWRKPEKVCESWDEYCKDWWAWRPFDRKKSIDGGRTWRRYAIGYDLVNVRPASLLLMSYPDLEDAPSHMTGKSAREALWEALGEGRIKATALPQDDALRPSWKPVEIPTNEWPRLSLTGTDQLDDTLSFHRAMAVVAYREVMVRRDDILSIWPASDDLHKAPAANESIDVTVKGRTTKAIEMAIRELFPDGVKVNATRRNEMIIEHVKSAIGTKPNLRTVQRVLADMAKGRPN